MPRFNRYTSQSTTVSTTRSLRSSFLNRVLAQLSNFRASSKRRLGVFLAALCVCAVVASLFVYKKAAADVSFLVIGVNVTENFDTIGNSATATLPTAWKVDSATATTIYASAATATTQAAGTTGTGVVSGSSSGGTYNFANGITASSIDRAVGWLSSGGYSTPRNLFVQLTNNTNLTVNSLTVNYDIEKYRSGSRAFDINFFSSTDGSTWTPQTAGDQSYVADLNNTTISNPPSTISKSFTISGLSLANGANIYLRWSYTGIGGSTNGQGLGIDNFSASVNISPPALQFRSKTSGNWNASSTWEVSTDGTTWVDATTTPNASNGAITIRTGHTVNVTADVNADELAVNTDGITNGFLLINSGVTFSVLNGTAATDLTIDGLVGIAGTLSVGAGAVAQVNGVLRIDGVGFPSLGSGTFAYHQTTGTLAFNTSGTYVVNNDSYWPTSNGPQNVAVGTGNILLNVARTVGLSFETSANVQGAANLTLNGLFTIFTGGSVTGSPTYGSASTLIYNTPSGYTAGDEWVIDGSKVGPPNNVTIQASSGTVNMGVAGTHTLVGNMNIVSGTLSMGGGGGDLRLHGNWTNSGTFDPSNRTVHFEGSPAQAISKSGGETFYDLVVNKPANGVTLNSPVNVDGLNLVSGIVTTSATNLLTVASGPPHRLSGGSLSSYINGPLARVLPASLAPGTTYLFPVGKAGFNPFELVNPTTNAGGTITVQAEEFDGASGGTAGTGMSALNANRYWSASITANAANFTNTAVRLTDSTVAAGNVIGKSDTQGGTYNSIGGTVAGATILSDPITSFSFFNIGAAAAAPCVPPSTVYVDDSWVGTTPGTDPDAGTGPASNFGCDSFATIQEGVNGVATGGTVNVLAGTYDEDVSISNSGLQLLGAGVGSVTVRGAIGGDGATIRVLASNVTIAGMTITRLGNNPTDWNNPGLNSAGIAIQGTAHTGALIRDNIITGNRSGIDINNSNGHTIRNNVIDDNRTGIILRNQNDTLTFVENFVTNNWTVGVIFLDGSGGTNAPVQSFTNSAFNNNDISANWYGQIVDRQTGGSLPAPNTTNIKNFRGNWLGTTSPIVTTDNSTEPGYAAQIPVAYGGTATPPGGQPDIAGPASANIKYIPFLQSGTDTNVETTPGRGTNGFQGVTNTVTVLPSSLNGWVPTTSLTASTSFVHGPATPPLGVGSGQLSVGTDGDSGAQFRQTVYNGTLLSDVTALTYSTYTSNDTTAPPIGDQTIYIILNTDKDGDGANDTLLFFEPEYQHGYTVAVPDQGDNVLNTWQTWDARGGGWYAIDSAAFTPVFAGPGSNVEPLNNFITAFPAARIHNSATTGSVRLVAGFGAPSWDNFVGNVDNFQISINAAKTIYDFEPLPRLSIDDVTLAEGNTGQTSFTFTVTLSRAVSQTVTVDVATADNSATAPSDYTSVPTTQLVFNPGDTSKPVTVLVNGDNAVESDEQFFVNLSNVDANAEILDAQGVGTITNDDAQFSIADVTLSEGNAGTTSFTFNVTKSGANGFATSVEFATADGTAKTANNDYSSNSGTLNFGPTDTTMPVTVLVNGDVTPEPNETFFVNLSNPVGASILDAQGKGTITNDDGPPSVVYVDDDWVAVQNGTDPDGAGPATEMGFDAFSTIQGGVSGVASGGTVNVAEGTYTENVTITQPLTLKGAQFGVDARGRVASESTVSPATASSPTFTVSFSGTITIDGFAFTGGTALGVIQTTVGPNNNMQIANNRFSGYSQSALFLNRGGTDITIDKNVMDGSNIIGSGQAIFCNGPQIFNGLFITNNNVVNNTGRAGFFVDGNHNVGESATRAPLIDSNLFDNNNVGMNLGSRSFGKQLAPTLLGGPYAGFITNNTFSNNLFDGVQGGIQRVLVKGNTFNSNDRSGLALTSFGNTVDATRGGQNSDIISNTFMGNGTVSTTSGEALLFSSTQPPGTISTNHAHFNRIVGNVKGTRYEGTETIDVENNWWGCNAGPNQPGCDTVTGAGAANTDFNPWLVLGVSASPNPIIPGGTSTVTADLTHNSDGAVPSATDFIPPTPVAFSATEGDLSTSSGTLTNGQATTTFTSTSASNGTASATVDNETETTTITVTPPSFSIDDVTLAEGDAGTTSFTFTVTRNGGTNLSSSVDFATADGTATVAGGDYAATSGTLTFAANEPTKPVTVLVTGDTIFETNETFFVNLSNPSGATIGDGQGQGTITNDDAAPTLTIDDVTKAEGDAGPTIFTFTVTRTGATEVASSVDFATADGSAQDGNPATEDSDYQPTSGTLNFAANETTMPITVTVNGDLTIEPNEQFFVNLTNPVNATTTDQGVGTITNDDTEVTVTVAPSTTAEDGGPNLVYTFTRTPLTAGDITVNFTVGGTATFGSNPGDDYTQTGAATFNATSGTVVIPNSSTTATVSIDPTTDGTVEQDESVDLTVTSGTGYNVGSPSTASATITNDDTDISVAVAPTPIAEDDPPNQLTNPVMVYTFTRTGVTAGAITVGFSVGGVAVFPADYTQTGASSFTSSSGTVEFGDGVTTATVTIDPVTEAIYETDETVTLTVVAGTGYGPADSPNHSATGTINDNDLPPTLSIGDRIANEGTTGPATTTNFVFTVTRTGATEVTATVDFATADGVTNAATGGASCGAGVDYVSQNGSLTFLPNEPTKTITILVCRDSNVEANETFFVNLDSPTEATINDGQGRGTIQNDDSPGTSLIVNTTDDLDDGTCNAAHCSLREVIVAASASPGADAIGISFDIPATDPRHFYYADDSAAGQVTNDVTHVLATTASDDTTIVGIDPDWPHSWWSILPTSSLPSITHRVLLDGFSQTGASANTLTPGNNAVLTIELSGASAGPGASGLTFNTSTSTVGGLVVNRFTGHGLDQGGTSNSVVGNFIGTDVSGTLDLGNTLNGINNTGSSATIGGSTPADVNLVSGNGGDGVAFTSTNSVLVLGNLIGTKADAIAALGNGGNGISFAGGGSVFNTVGGTQAGDANTIAFNGADGLNLATTAAQGNAIRGNSIYSNGGAVANNLGIDLGADGVTTNDATDPDTGPNNLQNFPIITVARVTGSTRTISGTLNSTPTVNPLAPQTFTIDFYQSPACDTSGNGEGKTYLASITTDPTDANGDVSFSFHPTPLLNIGQVITATATSTGASSGTSEFSLCAPITDGSPGAGDIQFTDATYTVGEAGVTASITVKRVGGSNGSVTTAFSTSNGSATAGSDYTAVPGESITFVEGETANKTVFVQISDDSVYEGNETVLLSLGSTVINATKGNDDLQAQADPHSAVLTITENDPPPSFTIDDVAHLEGNSEATDYRFTVTKTGSTALNATVDYATAPGSATSPPDFNAQSATTLTFLPGETTKQFTVIVNGDTTVEPDESFFVNLSNPTNATIADGVGAGTITNDDTDVTVAVSPGSVVEDGVPNLVYTFTRTGVTTGALTVNFSVSGSALFSSDYTQTGAASFNGTSGTVNFAAGNTTAQVTLDPSADSSVEADETAILTVTSGADYNASPTAATGAITNDDTDVTVAVSPSSAAEDGAANLVYTFTRSGVTTGALTVNFSVAGTAAFSADYTETGAATFTATNGTVTFGAGNSTAAVTIDPASDSTVESDETVILTVAAGAGYNVASPSEATGTITNDDADVTIAVLPSSVTEDGAANLIYTFTRNGATTGALTIDFSVAGTAAFGTDYTQTGAASFNGTSGTVNFAAGNSTAAVALDPSADATVESDETAVLTVTAGTGYNVASPSSATGTITTDDTDVTVAVSPGSVTEDGVPNLVYTFTRNGMTTGALTVNFSVAGTAAFGTDYTQTGAASFNGASGTVNFAAGNSTAAVTIDPATDNSAESDETVILTVTAGTGYNAASPSSATGTITNDDAAGGIVKFSSASYNTTENSRFVTVTVERTGDTSGAVTVDYATPDDSDSATVVPCATVNGFASPRCDFTTALGTLRFAAGETSKTFAVLISQDNYVEGPEALTLTLSNLTGGAVFGVPATATLTIDDDPTEPATNPIDDAENFVRQHYHDFLNREPDPSGLAFWTDQITSCGTDQNCIQNKRVHVSAAFYLSIEFQGTGYFVERLYKAAYGDATGSSTNGGAHTLPVPVVRFSEFLLDTQEIGLGVIVGQTGWEAALENNKAAFVVRFVERARFTTDYPAGMTAADFVDELNANAGNPLSQAERDQLVSDLSTSTKTRAQVLRAVTEDSDLVSAEFNRAFVLMQYFGYLRRNPNAAPDSDHTGYDFWLAKLNQFNGDFVAAEMVKAFITSGEYRRRSGQ